jgi:hypothetical protein
MNRDEIVRKVQREARLTPRESALLEVMLEEQRGQEAAAVVKSLKRDEPSLAWRSSVNERIAKSAVKPRKSWQFIKFAPPVALAAAVTAWFAIVYGSNGDDHGVNGTNITSFLYEWHEEASAAVILPDGGTDLDGFLNRTGHQSKSDVDELLYGRSVIEQL